MVKIKKVYELRSWEDRYPMAYQGMNVEPDDVKDITNLLVDKKFQNIQEEMKKLLKPIIMKHNQNATDEDIEGISDTFFKLGPRKNQEIKNMVNNIKSNKKCAQKIIDRFYKIVQNNYYRKDSINDVENTTE